jgi:hypothetical protein
MLRNHAPAADLPYRLLLKPWIHAALLPSGLLWNYRYPSLRAGLGTGGRSNEESRRYRPSVIPLSVFQPACVVHAPLFSLPALLCGPHQASSDVQPYRVADDLHRKARILVGRGSGRCHHTATLPHRVAAPPVDNALGRRKLLPREPIVDAAYMELECRDNLDRYFT